MIPRPISAWVSSSRSRVSLPDSPPPLRWGIPGLTRSGEPSPPTGLVFGRVNTFALKRRWRKIPSCIVNGHIHIRIGCQETHPNRMTPFHQPARLGCDGAGPSVRSADPSIAPDATDSLDCGGSRVGRKQQTRHSPWHPDARGRRKSLGSYRLDRLAFSHTDSLVTHCPSNTEHDPACRCMIDESAIQHTPSRRTAKEKHRA